MNNISTNEKILPWTKHYDLEVPITLNYPNVTLDELFRRSVKDHSEAIALIFFGREIRYRQLGHWVNSLAGAMEEIGH
ncbi:hypothetical protein [Desulfosporosinus sp.]|uniref:hypothetical protein n=1 Tax=Desulfosporosinus sp. TaxID=157907 RepID=UPI002314AF21|nr:hypothetical protein [Desulfosporosinus sp.]MDA8223549.1 hypothetical protein [Desulfitobacterium hafniense]